MLDLYADTLNYFADHQLTMLLGQYEYEKLKHFQSTEIYKTIHATAEALNTTGRKLTDKRTRAGKYYVQAYDTARKAHDKAYDREHKQNYNQPKTITFSRYSSV